MPNTDTHFINAPLHVPAARQPWPTAHLRMALWLAVWLLGAATLARVALWFWFAPPQTNGLGPTLLLGARFDLRIALLSTTPLWLLAALPWLGRWLLRPLPISPKTQAPRHRTRWRLLWASVLLGWAWVYITDFGNYAYWGQRLTSQIFSLMQDMKEAQSVVWDSYPVLRLLLGVALWLWLGDLWLRLGWQRWVLPMAKVSPRHPTRQPWLARAAWGGLTTVLVIVCIGLMHGRLSQYPLRWSDVTALPNDFARKMAINPVQSLYDTRRFTHTEVDAAQMRAHFNTVRTGFLNLPALAADAPLSLMRNPTVKAANTTTKPMNVVLVLLESWAAHKVGAMGNPMGATPHFDALTQQGHYFPYAFSAHGLTARGVFASLTGIPDVTEGSTASRNPLALDQHLIMNDFQGYEKFYFLGGSTSWANVRGVLSNNIAGLTIYEEGNLKTPANDVWGVPDHKLLQEADQTLRAQTKPFFAIIQTASNHPPFTIPDDVKTQFSAEGLDEAALVAQGFVSKEQFVSMRYLDWSIGQFMQQAKSAPYFDNALFVFIGDHGVYNATLGPHMPRTWNDYGLTHTHTNLLFLAPKHLQPKRDERWVQQVDVMTSIADKVGMPHRNTTLGRSVFDPQYDGLRHVFLWQGLNNLGFASGAGYLSKTRDAANAAAAPNLRWMGLSNDQANQDLLPTQDATTQAQLQANSQLLDAYHQVSQYLITHNPRLPSP